MRQQRADNRYVRLTAFFSGMAVMAVELTGSRLLAPYFGTSLYVWSNLIGVVLTSLAAGYYCGGLLADRLDGEVLRQRLFVLILICGLVTTAMPFAAGPLARALEKQSHSIFLLSFAATGLLFAFPMVLFGMMSPMMARLCLSQVEEGGRTFGTIYGLSTAGSIVGTFLPVWLTIPLLGSRRSFFLFGASLLILGGFGLKKKIVGLLLLFPLIALARPGSFDSRVGKLFEGESLYHYVRVTEPLPGFRLLQLNEGIGAQSVLNRMSPFTGNYWDGAVVLPSLRPEGRDFLILGLGGGSSARVLHHFFPALRLTGVEIDPMLVEAGRRFMDLGETGVTPVVSDARLFLSSSPASYDFIMVDAFRDNQVIPFHLASREFFGLIADRLRPGGGMMLNLSAAPGDEELGALLKRTVAAVFPHVYVLRAYPFNELIYAFREPPHWDHLGEGAPAALHDLLQSYLKYTSELSLPKGEVATDDRSRVEILSARVVSH